MVNNNKVLWTPTEDQLIRDHYPEMGQGMLHMLPGRAVASLQVRASKLRVKNLRSAQALSGYQWPEDTFAPVWRSWDVAASPVRASW